MSAHVFKVTLEHTKPPVWRRIVIPENATFEDLHIILQIAFGWEAEHLHNFTFSDSHFSIGPVINGMLNDSEDESDEFIDDYLDYKWIRYTYDFGDDWEHKIVYETDDPDYDKDYAEILKYRGDDFIEDSGGVWYGKQKIFSLDKANAKLAAHKIASSKGKDSLVLDKKYEDFHDFALSYLHDEAMEFYRGKDTESITEMLDDSAIEDLYRLLGHKDNGLSLEEKKQTVISEMLATPQYYAAMFNAEELEFLQKCARTEEDSDVFLDAPSAVFTGFFTGVLDVTYRDSRHAEIHFAKDFVPVLLKMRPAEYKKTDKKLNQISERVIVLLKAFGLLKKEDLVKKYAGIFPEDKKKDYPVMVSMHMYLEGQIQELHNKVADKVPVYISLRKADTGRIYNERQDNDRWYYPDVTDKNFTRSEIRDRIYKKDESSKLHAHINEIVGRVVEELEDFENQLDEFLLYGSDYDEMPERFGYIYNELNDIDKVDFWYTLINLVLKTNTPQYHGWTLEEYASKVHLEPWDILKDQSDITSDDPQKTLLEITVTKARNAYECIKNKDMDKAKRLAKYKDDRKLIYDYMTQK